MPNLLPAGCIETNLFTAPGQFHWVTNGVDADATVDGIEVLGVHTVDASWFLL